MTLKRPKGCECDNTHEQNNTCCMPCWNAGFRKVAGRSNRAKTRKLNGNALLQECFKHFQDAYDRDELGDKDCELYADIEKFLRENGYKTI